MFLDLKVEEKNWNRGSNGFGDLPKSIFTPARFAKNEKEGTYVIVTNFPNMYKHTRSTPNPVYVVIFCTFIFLSVRLFA